MWTLICAACLLATAQAAQSSPPVQPAETDEPQTRIDASFAPGHESSGILPIDLVNDTRIYVPGQVNGREISVLLDTGAAWTVIDKRLAADLGLPASGHRMTLGTGGAVPSQYAFGVSIDLGRLQLRDVTVLILDLEPVEQRLGISLPVVIGPEAFATVIADIDVPSKTVEFRSRDSWRPPMGATKVAAEPVQGIRAIGLSIEGRPEAPFAFDIGNGSTALLIYPHYAKENDLLRGRRTATQMSGAVGGERLVPVARMKEVGLAGMTIRDVPSQFPPDDGSTSSRTAFAGNIGMPLLGKFRLITDFSDDTIWVVPGPKFEAEIPRDRSGVTFSRSAEGLRVVSLAGPALQSRLKPGDMIVAARKPGGEWRTIRSWPSWNTERGPIQLRLASGQTRRLVLADYF
jgi:predicted aspartyl protease